MPNEIVSIAASRPTDAEAAAEILARFRAAMQPVLALMDEAAHEGLLLRWNVMPNAFGRHELMGLHLERHFY